MCGYFGIFSTNIGRVDEDELLNIIKIQNHRGPDSSGLYINSNKTFGLCHQRLSIISKNNDSDQPMSSDDGRFIIAFNGEIYNYIELRSMLAKRGVSFRTSSDTEVLLKLLVYSLTKNIPLQKVSKIVNGMYSYALFDSKTEDLFLSRDRFGIKPTYFFQYQSDIIFSSELKGIINTKTYQEFKNSRPESSTINVNSVFKAIEFIWIPGLSTVYEGIYKLVPGKIAKVNYRNFKINNFESFNLRTKSKNDTFNKNTLDNLLRSAVHRQLRADVPVALLFSGGLDSSLVYKYALEKHQGIKTYSIKLSTINDEQKDDFHYADKISKQFGKNVTPLEVTSKQFINDLPLMLKHLEEPIADPAALNLYYLCKKAKSDGYKVLLSGVGGDELFFGYRRHKALYLDRLFKFIPNNLKYFLETTARKTDSKIGLFRKLQKLLNGISTSKSNRILNLIRWTDPKILKSILTENARQHYEVSNSSANDSRFEKWIGNLNDNIDPLNHTILFDREFYLPDHNLNYCDKLSMANSVEIRVPFLDNFVSNYARSFNWNTHLKNGIPKYMLKKVASMYFSNDIVHRSKAGFGLPIRTWIRKDMASMIEEVLIKDKLNSAGIFQKRRLKNLFEENEKGTVDASYTILSILCIELWLRQINIKI